MKTHHLFIPHSPNSLLSLIFLFTCFFQNIRPVSAESVVWFETGSMNHPRPGHTATVLPNGKVLVAGGDTDSVSLSSAELYDPATGTWTVTGSMNAGRYSFGAVLLPNGKVLVAGGWDHETDMAINSAELYDPTTGTWSFTGSMNNRRNAHEAILLSNGKVIIAGGEDYAYHDLTSAELYDPATGNWTYTGSMNNTHGHYNPPVLLSNGKVLITGSAENPSCELYDPATSTWTTTGSMNVVRRGHLAVRLPNGKVLAAGGSVAGVPGSTNSAELYDPATGTWTTINPMNFNHSAPTASKLTNGKILVTGGDQSTGRAELFYINTPPDPNAGPNQSVNTLTEVTLDGSSSYDPDGDTPLSYFWTQTSGISVQLNNPNLMSPTFISPSDPGVVTFSLIVTDSRGSPDLTGDEVIITIRNQAPVSIAGQDQSVKIYSTVTLDGSNSADPDGDLPLDYLWVQTSGIPVTLSDPNSSYLTLCSEKAGHRRMTRLRKLVKRFSTERKPI